MSGGRCGGVWEGARYLRSHLVPAVFPGEEQKEEGAGERVRDSAPSSPNTLPRCPFLFPRPFPLRPPSSRLPHHCYVPPALFFTPLVPSLPSLDCGFSPAFLKKTPVPQCQGQLPRAFKPQNCSARPIRVSSPSHVRGSRGTERSRNLPEVTQFTGGRSPPKAETRNQSPQVAQHLDLNSGLLTLRSDFFPLHPTHSAHRLRPFC